MPSGWVESVIVKVKNVPEGEGRRDNSANAADEIAEMGTES